MRMTFLATTSARLSLHPPVEFHDIIPICVRDVARTRIFELKEVILKIKKAAGVLFLACDMM